MRKRKQGRALQVYGKLEKKGILQTDKIDAALNFRHGA
jgi:hypothetical protein